MAEKEVTPTLEPLAFFGVSPEIKGCGCFLNEYTFAHISGRLLITEDFRDRRQSYWHIPKYGEYIINAVAYDNKREYMAVAEQRNPPILTIYRLSDHKRVFYMSPKDAKCDKFTTMFFHCDSDRFSVLLGQPENIIYTCYLDDGTVESVTTAMHKNLDTEVTQIFGHFEDTFHYAIVGIGIFRFMTWMGDIWEDVFRSFNQAEGIPFTSGTYVSYDTIAAGTADGKVYIIAHDGIKGIYDALTADRLYVEVKKKGTRAQEPIAPPAGDVSKDGYTTYNQVQYMQGFTKGIVYVVQGEMKETIHMFLKGRFGEGPNQWIPDLSYRPPSDDDPYPRHGFVKAPVGQVKEYDAMLIKNRPLFVITNLTMTQHGKLMALTFSGRFLMLLDAECEFPSKETSMAKFMTFGINRGPIERVAVCLWKHDFYTLSERVLKVYNYKQRRVYHVFTFQDYAYSLCIHPTGFFGLVGFSECVIMFTIQQSFFAPLAKIGVECCKAMVFSDLGEILLLADAANLRIYETYKFTQKKDIVDCQAGKINYIHLCPSRDHIWYSTTTGLIAKTSIKDGNKNFIFQTSPCKSFSLYNNYKMIYVAGYDGWIKEIDVVQNRMTQEVYVRHGQISDVCVSQRKHLLFVGTETGYMMILKCPLSKDAEPIFKMRLHYAPIMKLAMSKDENYLISSGKDGSVCLWGVYPKTPDHWLRVYTQNPTYPIPANYKVLGNDDDLVERFEIEKDYCERRRKMGNFSYLKKYREEMKPLLDCLMENEMEEKIRPRAKFVRFEEMEKKRDLDAAAKDLLLHQEYNYDHFKMKFYEQAIKEFDVQKLLKEKEEELQDCYLSRMNQMFNELDALNKYFYGGLFLNFKENVADNYRDTYKFMKFYKKKIKKRTKDTIYKVRNLIALKTSPKYLKKRRKRENIQHRCKEVMQAALHKEIARILKYSKATQELQRVRGEYVSHPFDSDNEASLAKQESISEESSAPTHISLIHSDDPLNPMNSNNNQTKLMTPPPSINVLSDDNDDDSQKVVWPQSKKNKDYLDKLKNIMYCKQRKLKKKSAKYQTMGWNVSTRKNEKQHLIYKLPDPKELSKTEKKIEEKRIIKQLEYDKEANMEKSQDSEKLKVKSFTILKEKGYFKNRGTSGKAIPNGRLFEKAFSKLKSSKRKQQKLEEFISKWNLDEKQSEMIPLEKPLTRRHHGFILRTDTEGKLIDELRTLVQKEQRKPSLLDGQVISGGDRRPTILQIMYSIYIHPETIVKKIPTLHLFKNKFPKSKFKSLLMKYSPLSKLSKLATKHLVSTHLLRLHQKEQQEQEVSTSIKSEKPEPKKLSVRDAVNFDRFSELGDGSLNTPNPCDELSSKDSFVSISNIKLQKSSAKSESLSSLIEFSGYSQTTLPEILKNCPSQREANIVNSSDQRNYAPEKSTKSREPEKSLGESNTSKIHETLEKSKRWLKLIHSTKLWGNGDAPLDQTKHHKKLIKAIAKGEREAPFFHELNKEKLKTKISTSKESLEILRNMPEEEIVILKKLKVLKQISDPSEEMPQVEIDAEVISSAGQSRQFEEPEPSKPVTPLEQPAAGSTNITHDASSTIPSSSICSHDPFDFADLIGYEKKASSFIRTGRLNLVDEEGVKYDVTPKKIWNAFDPPISKDLMKTLRKYDLISKIQAYSSNENSSEESDIYSFSKSDSSPFDYEKIHLKDSDKALWKDYFLEEEEEIKRLKEKTYEEGLQGDFEQFENEIIEGDLIRDLPKISDGVYPEDLSAVLEEEFLEEDFSQHGTEDELHSAILSESKYFGLKQKEDDSEEEKTEEEKEARRKLKMTFKKKEPEKKQDKKKETETLDEEAFLFADSGPEKEDKSQAEEVEEEVYEESDGKKLDEYLKFLKQFKGFFIYKELFPEKKTDETEQNLEEEAEEELEGEVKEELLEDLSENVPTSRESKTEVQETSNEQTMLDGGQIKKDGAPQVSFKTRYRKKKSISTYSTKSSKSGLSSNKKSRKSHKTRSCSRNRKQMLVREVWQWWNELLCFDDKPTSQIYSHHSFSSSDLQKDGCNSKLEADGKMNNTSSEDSEDTTCKTKNDEKDISEEELFQQMNNIIPPNETAPDALISTYNMRLWKKLFGIDHPKTVKSYDLLSENIEKRKLEIRAKVKSEKLDLPIFTKSQIPKNKEFLSYKQKPLKEKGLFKEVILPSISEISYDNIYKKSLPKPKDPNAPSDEIESISSPSYIIHVTEEDNKYSLYIRQTVRIKTNLKNKIWFVPEGGRAGEYTKGRFYYPGDVWTKGRTSRTLRYEKVPIIDPTTRSKKTSIRQGQKLIPKKPKQHQIGGKNIKHPKKHRTGIPKTHPLHSKEVELQIKKSKRLCLLKENLEKVKFIKINMPFGAFYILPFRLKQFWKMLSKTIGSHLTIKLRSEVIRKSRATKKTSDVYKSKSKSKKSEQRGPSLEANIDTSGIMQLKLLFLEKLPLNEKEFTKLLPKNKLGEEIQRKAQKLKGREIEISKIPQLIHSTRENKVLNNKVNTVLSKQEPTKKNAMRKSKDQQQQCMFDLVAEFFPECRSHHGSFYKELKIKKWFYSFKEAWGKSRAKDIKKRFADYKSQTSLPKPKILDPFKQKYLNYQKYLKELQRQKDPNKKKLIIDKNLKSWLKRHIGVYKGPGEKLQNFKDNEIQEVKSNTLPVQKSSKFSSEIKIDTLQTETKIIKPTDELNQKVKEWLALHYKYLRKKRKMEVRKPYTYENLLKNENMPYFFVQRVQHFERNVKRMLNSLKKADFTTKTLKKKVIGRDKKRIPIRKATDIIEHYSKRGGKCYNELKMKKDHKLHFKKLRDDSLDQLFSTKRWKEAMFEVCSKEKENIQNYLTEKNSFNAEAILDKLGYWKLPERNICEMMLASKGIVSAKPYLKLRWPDSVLKAKKKITKEITPFSYKRKYAEPVLKFISTKEELIRSNKRRVLYHRLLKANATVSICGQKLKYLPKGFRARMANLPYHFKLTALDNNYYYLSKLKNHFVDRNLSDLKKYCVNAFNINQARRQAHDLKLFYEHQKEGIGEELKERDEFLREFDINKIELKQWKQKTKKTEQKLREGIKNTQECWALVENLKHDLAKVVEMCRRNRQKKDIKEVLLALNRKYESYSTETVKTAMAKRTFKEQVIRDLEAEILPYKKIEKKYNNPLRKRIDQANRYVKFAHNQNLVQDKPKENILEDIPPGESMHFGKSYLRQEQIKLEEFLKSVTKKKKNEGLDPKLTDRILTKELTKKLKYQTVALNKLEQEVMAARNNLKLGIDSAFFT